MPKASSAMATSPPPARKRFRLIQSMSELDWIAESSRDRRANGEIGRVRPNHVPGHFGFIRVRAEMRGPQSQFLCHGLAQYGLGFGAEIPQVDARTSQRQGRNLTRDCLSSAALAGHRHRLWGWRG